MHSFLSIPQLHFQSFKNFKKMHSHFTCLLALISQICTHFLNLHSFLKIALISRNFNYTCTLLLKLQLHLHSFKNYLNCTHNSNNISMHSLFNFALIPQNRDTLGHDSHSIEKLRIRYIKIHHP